jgi:hypothetical protein
MAALAAMAASIALPPFSSIWIPARAASGWLDATIPNFVATTERPVTTGRRCRGGAESGSLSCAVNCGAPMTVRTASNPARRVRVIWAPEEVSRRKLRSERTSATRLREERSGALLTAC